MAAYMAYVRHMPDGASAKEILVCPPPKLNAVEQLLALQQALVQLEGLIQSGNIFLLKSRALVLSALPEVSLLDSLFPMHLIVKLLWARLEFISWCNFLHLSKLPLCQGLNFQCIN